MPMKIGARNLRANGIMTTKMTIIAGLLANDNAQPRREGDE